jgi:serine/threonine-protein kinase
LPELDGLLNLPPDGARPPKPGETVPASRSRETAGLPAVERWLGDEPDLAGRTLGGFRIEKRLGSGAVGTVYLAEQLALGRPVALKVLAGARAANSEYLARFVREARVVARLVHPNAVQVYDVGEADGYHYIALEYVEGQTVAELLERRGRLPWKAALEIVRQAAASLGRAHEMGIVHRTSTRWAPRSTR